MGVDLFSSTTVLLPASAEQSAAVSDDISRQAEFSNTQDSHQSVVSPVKIQWGLFSCFSAWMAWLCLAVMSAPIFRRQRYRFHCRRFTFTG